MNAGYQTLLITINARFCCLDYTYIYWTIQWWSSFFLSWGKKTPISFGLFCICFYIPKVFSKCQWFKLLSWASIKLRRKTYFLFAKFVSYWNFVVTVQLFSVYFSIIFLLRNILEVFFGIYWSDADVSAQSWDECPLRDQTFHLLLVVYFSDFQVRSLLIDPHPFETVILVIEIDEASKLSRRDSIGIMSHSLSSIEQLALNDENFSFQV